VLDALTVQAEANVVPHAVDNISHTTDVTQPRSEVGPRQPYAAGNASFMDDHGPTYFAAVAVGPVANVHVALTAGNPRVPRTDSAKVAQTIVGVNTYNLMMATKQELEAERSVLR
jgi:hypothetical protein